MLFYISEELIEEGASLVDQNRIIRAIENVLKSAWESKHLVHAELATIIRLREIVGNRDCLNVLIFIENNYSFLNYESINQYINVVCNQEVVSTTENNGKKIINVPIGYFQSNDLLQECRILCEDITDASFFEEISNYYIRTNSIGSVFLKYEAEHGGGNLINVPFKKHADSNNKLCLAFCDNDKRYPNSEVGDTLRRLRAIDISNNCFCNCIELEAQEIENLVPFNYLDEIQERFHNPLGVEFIKTIYESENREHLKYYDIKKGVSKKQVSSNQDFFNFMESLLPYCNGAIRIDELDALDENEKIIPHTGKIIPSLMKKKELFHSVLPSLLSYQRSEWNKIGSIFLYWACSRGRESMNL